ncbi:MAG: GNAT family N-acetyltransferase [Sandaracinaceae bacterium]|nr:GNAT family N-acetyltransferase [Sandaracinaceae bacterium]
MTDSERLTFEDYTPDHAEEDLVIHADPEVMRFLGGVQHTTVEAMREHLTYIANKYRAYRERGLPYVAWAVREKAGGALVGTGLLKPLPDGDGVDTEHIEVGWHLGRAWWGRGYATELGHALVARGFRTLPVDTLHVVTEIGNVRSEAVAKRLGMTYQGRSDAWYGNTVEHYTLARAAWASR